MFFSCQLNSYIIFNQDQKKKYNELLQNIQKLKEISTKVQLIEKQKLNSLSETYVEKTQLLY
jgi:hypothetical protein